MFRIFFFSVALGVACGCSDSEANRKAEAERVNAEAKQELDKIFPGGRAMVDRIQRQIEWKKKHGVTREQANAMCAKWIEANPDKTVEQFWAYAVTVTPADL